MKTKRFLSFAAIFAISLTFFACSSESPSGGGQQGGEPSSNSSGGSEMVFCKLTSGACSQKSYSTCMELVNAGEAQIVSNCNAEPLPSSSSAPPPSSSSIAPLPSSSSVAPSLSSSSRPSSSSRVVSGYCDYGPLVTQANGEVTGGCFPMSTADDEANCALWGNVVSSCPSSSSVVKSSSSVATFGVFTDTRDSKLYYWTKIGTQTWMGENLNYTPTSGSSKCPDNLATNCTKYGRQYDWATAMGLTSSYNSTLFNMPNSNRQGVCPTGWHLPSSTEWSTLVTYVGTNPGTKLKATSGWPGINANGTDIYDFTALPGGYVEYGTIYDSYIGVGTMGLWWTATEYNANYAYDKMMDSGTDTYTGVYNYGNATNNYSWTKRDMLSVRCIKD